MEYILAFAAIFGVALASYYDLKTSEVPDIIAVLMITFGVSFHFSRSLISGEWIYFISSITFGVLMLAFGFLRYLWREWGGADALMLGAISFMLPYWPKLNSNLPFPLVFVINLFLIGVIYILAYVIIMSFSHRRVYSELFRKVRGSVKEISYITFGYLAIIFIFFIISKNFLLLEMSLTFYLLILALYILYHYLRIFDTKILRKKIKSHRLKPGDVLAHEVRIGKLRIGARIDGLTEKEIELLKKKFKEVEIIEGVRYVPSFLITLVFTLFYGNILEILFFVS
jgi:Flp pilus assembly protein protease CpaA